VTSARGEVDHLSADGAAGEATVDVDVHVVIPSIESLYPYMESGWPDWIRSGGFRRPPTADFHYPPGAPISFDERWRDDDGGEGGLEALRGRLLDRGAIEKAIVHPYWGIEGVRHPEVAAVLARAINDWLFEEWLSEDDRLLGTVTVPHHDPRAAMAEVERCAARGRFVQVGLPVWSQLTWGKRIWHPLFASIADAGLVAGIHYGGQTDGAPTPTGWPSYLLEQHAAAPHMFLTQLVSMVAEGVFQMAPTLRVSFLESGFSWLPVFLWRMDKEWRGLRRDVPWIDRPPSEIVREHLKVCVQPIDGIPSTKLREVVEWLGPEMLMYGSDHPHAQPESVDALLDGLPEEQRLALLGGNAVEHYRL
jgi:predicted TIM-barrel fold metal-dependent hydrolase